jgi:protein-S-isoprenylcysteine O-methyltransferase Ste14
MATIRPAPILRLHRALMRADADGPSGGGWGSAARVAAATAAFALVHSTLASRRAKSVVRRAVGDRTRDGWYRLFYNAQAIATAGAVAAYARRLPDRPLYQLRGPAAALLRLGQLAGLVVGAAAVRQVGLSRMAGATSLAAWVRGRSTVPSEPEAQGPAPDSSGRLRAAGPFAWSRHPLNLAPLPVLWLNPRMTVNLAAFNVAATLYLVAGSRHEEARLAAAYGDAYETYRRSGVPFYLPRVRRPALPPAPTVGQGEGAAA